MRLLNSKSKQLELVLNQRPPCYAIVSHRWGDASEEEVLFTDIGDQARAQSKRNGYQKILGSCSQATQDGLDYVWLDTCCIDKSKSTELDEAINSMYEWYHQSEVCYAYLHDITDPSEFTESNWFSRGWTLQELIAPRHLKFFTKDWSLIGTREDLIEPVSQRTGICKEILKSGKIPREVTISEKMVWAAHRATTKMEDSAYSLLGIFGVNLVPLYGIDDDAFEDLQHRIIAKSTDQTLFTWYHTPDPSFTLTPVEGDANTHLPIATGLLASSPSQYLKSYEISEVAFRENYTNGIGGHNYRTYFSISNNFVSISLPVKHVEGKIWKAVLRCSPEPPDGLNIQRPLIVYLGEIQPWKFLRVHLPRNRGDGEVGDDQTKDVPGSLERLSDAETESNLEGYALRDIDVVGRYRGNLEQLSETESDQEGYALRNSDVVGRRRESTTEQPKPTPWSINETRYNWSSPRHANGSRSNFPHDLTGYVARQGEHPIASGGYGDIYRGTLRMWGRQSIDVAIKTIRTYTSEDPDSAKKIKRLRREIRVWMNLDHANVLRLFGTTTNFGRFPAMVCPWAENGPLTIYLERLHSTLTRSDRLALLNGVACGLHYLHSKSIVHGDLFGPNVLVQGDGRACIADFGLSTLLTELSASTFATSHYAKGSLRWMAPELVNVSEDEDISPNVTPSVHSDVYSFGGLMLQILTGNVPYHYYVREPQVMGALAKGITPKQPSELLVTEYQWSFIQQCWSPADAIECRPPSKEIVEWTRKELLVCLGREL